MTRTTRSTDQRGAATLAIESVHKSFEGVTVLCGADLEVHDGEILGIVGPNGAGKSTACRIVGGWIAADSGVIRVDGVDITRWSVAQRHAHAVREVPQFPQLCDHLPVDSHLLLSALGCQAFRHALRKTRSAWMTESQISVVRDLGLIDILHQVPRLLPLGVRKLVSVACAALGTPRVLLLDEPTVGLDGPQRDLLAGFLLTHCDDRTVVLVEHDSSFVNRCCTRVAELKCGVFQCTYINARQDR